MRHELGCSPQGAARSVYVTAGQGGHALVRMSVWMDESTLVAGGGDCLHSQPAGQRALTTASGWHTHLQMHTVSE